MRRYRALVEPEALADLEAIETYIASAGHPEAGERFVTDILKLCRTLELFPHRGTPHDGLREGLRSILFRRRATIFYPVRDDQVRVLGVAYAGRDPNTLMTERVG